MRFFGAPATAVVALVLLAGCGGGSGDEAPGSLSVTPGGTLPTSVPISTEPAAEGEFILFRTSLEPDVLATAVDHSRTFNLDFDPEVDTVLSVDCTRDGSRAAYLMEGLVSLDNRMVIVDASGRREVALRGEVVGAALSPDGGSVAFTSYLPDNQRGVLSLLDLGTEEVSVLYDKQGTIGMPRWSPDGKKIVFDAATDRSNQIFVHTLGVDGAQQMTDLVNSAFGADWAPDGSVIAFSSVTEGQNPQIFTVAAEGGEPVQLTSTQAFKANPRWSTDGSQIAYVGTIPLVTASRLSMGEAPAALRSRLHNIAVYTSARDGSQEAAFTDLALDAWLLGWCTAGPWLADGWTEQ